MLWREDMNKEEVRAQLINTLCWMKYSGHHLSETHTLKDAYDDYYFEISNEGHVAMRMKDHLYETLLPDETEEQIKKSSDRWIMTPIEEYDSIVLTFNREDLEFVDKFDSTLNLCSRIVNDFDYASELIEMNCTGYWKRERDASA